MAEKTGSLKLYYVVPHDDLEWGVMVVARTAKKARVLGYNGFPSQDDDYVDCRARLVRKVPVPEGIAEGTVFDTCDNSEWLCSAWRFGEMCEGCARYEIKRTEAEEAGEFDG